MDSAGTTPASTMETAATTPASNSEITSTGPKATSRPGGHAVKQSVANAAMLFAGSSDDPFATIGAIEEEPEPESTASQVENKNAIPNHYQSSTDASQSSSSYVHADTISADLFAPSDSTTTDDWSAITDANDPSINQQASQSEGSGSVYGQHNLSETLQINTLQSAPRDPSPTTPSKLFSNSSSADLFGPSSSAVNDNWLADAATEGTADQTIDAQNYHPTEGYEVAYNAHGTTNSQIYGQDAYSAYDPQSSAGDEGYNQQYGAYEGYYQSSTAAYDQQQHTGYDQQQQHAGYGQQQYDQSQQQYTGYDQQLHTGYNQQQYATFNQNNGQQDYSAFNQQQSIGYDQQQPHIGYDQQQQTGYDPQPHTGYDQQQQTGYDQQPHTGYDQQQQMGYEQLQYNSYDGYASQDTTGQAGYNYQPPQANHEQDGQYQPQQTVQAYQDQAYTQTENATYQPYDQQQPQQAYTGYEQDDQHGLYDQQPSVTNDVHQMHSSEYGQNSLQSSAAYQPTQDTASYSNIDSPYPASSQNLSSQPPQENKLPEETDPSLAQTQSLPYEESNAYEGSIEDPTAKQELEQVDMDNAKQSEPEPSIVENQTPSQGYNPYTPQTSKSAQDHGSYPYGEEMIPSEGFNSSLQRNEEPLAEEDATYSAKDSSKPNHYTPSEHLESLDLTQGEATEQQRAEANEFSYNNTYGTTETQVQSEYSPEDQTVAQDLNLYAPNGHVEAQGYGQQDSLSYMPESVQAYVPHHQNEGSLDASQYSPEIQRETQPYNPYAPQAQATEQLYDPYAPQQQSIGQNYTNYAAETQGSGYEYTAPAANPGTFAYDGSHANAQHETNPGRARIPLACFSIDGKLVTYFPSSSGSSEEAVNGNSMGGFGMPQNSPPTQVFVRSLASVIPSTTYATSMKPATCPGPLFEIGGSQISALSRATGAASSTNKNKKMALMKHLQDAANDLAGGLSYLHAGKHAVDLKRLEDRILLVRVLSIFLDHDGNLSNNPSFDKAVIQLLLEEQTDEEIKPKVQQFVKNSINPSLSSQDEAEVLHKIENCLVRGERREAVSLAKDNKLWTHAVVIASGMDKDSWRDVVRSFMEETLDDDSHQPLKVAYGLFSGQDVKATYDIFRSKQSLNTFSPPAIDSESSTESEAAKESLEKRKDWRKSVAMIIANRPSNDMAHLTAIGDGLSIGGWIEGAHVCYLLSLPNSGLDGFDGPGGARLTLLGTQSPAASSAYLRDLDAIILTEALEFALSLRPVPKGGEQFQGLPHLQAYRIVHALLLAEMGESKKALKYCEAITNLLKSGKMNKYYHTGLLQHLQEISDRLSGGDGKASNNSGAGSWAKKKPTMDGVWGALENRFTKFIAGEDDASSNGKDLIATGGQHSTNNKSTAQVGAFTHYSAITPEANSRGVSRVQSFIDFNSSTSPQHSQSNYGGYSTNTYAPQSTSSNASYSRPASRASSTLDIHNNSGRPGISPLSQNYQSNSGYIPSNRNPSSASAMMTSSSSTVEETNYSEWPTSAGPAHRNTNHSSRAMNISSDTDLYDGPYKTHSTRNAPWYDGGEGGSVMSGGAGNNEEDSTDINEGQTSEDNRFNNYDQDAAPNQPYYSYEANGANEEDFTSNVDPDRTEGDETTHFLSPMDALGGAPTPTFTSYVSYGNSGEKVRAYVDDDDEDDLGFGNSKSKGRSTRQNREIEDDDVTPTAETGSSPGATPRASEHDVARNESKEIDNTADKSTDSAKPEEKQGGELRQTSSWLGRLWGSRRGTPDPNEAKATRAHLGQETSFYYDKELKRWVNKAAGDAAPAAAPLPPPPRAATASPSVGRPMGGPPLREAQRAVSSSHLPVNPSGTGNGVSSGLNSTRSSHFSPPPGSSASSTISEMGEEEEEEMGRSAPPSIAGTVQRPPTFSNLSKAGGLGTRARSNLADHSQPPALQPARSFSAMSDASTANGGSTPPRPPPGGSGIKKKPINKRYVRVD